MIVISNRLVINEQEIELSALPVDSADWQIQFLCERYKTVSYLNA